ncbi:hypothetical protein EL84_02085 [Paenibacillus sp. VT-400]|nr:hypothetical protein EL84_02085 [Paenibacillus sp. VT-400]
MPSGIPFVIWLFLVLQVQKKDTEEQLRAYIKQLSRFTELQIEGQQVFKQALQRLIQKIEAIKDGSIKAIHYIFPDLNP